MNDDAEILWKPWWDGLVEKVHADQATSAVIELKLGLDEYRNRLDEATWASLCEHFVAHPFHKILLEDPYTHRAFHKPRGIAGDAVMLDFVYGHPSTDDELIAATPLGREIFPLTAGFADPAQAVRLRRSIAANFIERCALEHINATRVLAVAAGHMREYEWVHPEIRKAIYWQALEGDSENIAVLLKDYPFIYAMDFDLRSWLRQPPAKPICECIYALGLLDYLQEIVAERLVLTMYNCLTPGGRLLLGNFVPDAPGLGYMEAVMQWRLRYRTQAELAELAAKVPDASSRTWLDSAGCLAYLEMQKPAVQKPAVQKPFATWP